jgi:hypothetical protein
VPSFFDLPLNLPHAATISARIVYQLRQQDAGPEGLRLAGELVELLGPWRDREDNGAAEEAERTRQGAAALGRKIVDEIERGKLGADRLGQAVRNLFECLELGEEGAAISLRAGENPDSTLRP